MTKTMKITYTALFAAIATVLMQFEFPVPFMPPFLKIDFSGAAILIGAFIFGIGPGIAMALIKDLIRATMTQTGGSGELQDFILMVVLVVVAVSIYQRRRSRRGRRNGLYCGFGCHGMRWYADQLPDHHPILFKSDADAVGSNFWCMRGRQSLYFRHGNVSTDRCVAV